jgi:hypothetical protein
VDDERSWVEGIRDALDGISRFFFGILLLGIAVASIIAGGAAGWAFGTFLLALVGLLGIRGYLRLVRSEESDD